MLRYYGLDWIKKTIFLLLKSKDGFAKILTI